ncbi:hypothetical protein R6Q57_002886 [Mikania cordata]
MEGSPPITVLPPLNPHNPNARYIPPWDVSNQDLYSHASVCRKLALGFSIPSQKVEVGSLTNVLVVDTVYSRWAQLGSLLPEVARQWANCFGISAKAKENASKLTDQLSMQAKADLLHTEIGQAKEDLAKELASLEESRAALLDEKKNFKADETKMKVSFGQLLQQNQMLIEKLDEVTKDRVWLVIEGFKHVIGLLHRSPEFLEPLANVQRAAHAYGLFVGLKAGYRYALAGRPIETVSYHSTESKNKLYQAVQAFEEVQFPFFDTILQCVEAPLAILQRLIPKNLDARKTIEEPPSPSRTTVATPSSGTPRIQRCLALGVRLMRRCLIP